MKRLSTALVIALLLTLSPIAASQAATTTALAAKAEGKESRGVERLTCRRTPECNRKEPYWETNDMGRIKGEDGAGVFVFYQFRKCGQGKWSNLERETTTSTGTWDFRYTYKASERKKYQVKRYKDDFPNAVQFRFFIPSTDVYKAYRSVSPACYS